MPERSRRSILLPAAVAAVGVAILVSLGLWQIERKTWKEALIAALAERVTAAPVKLPPAAQWSSLSAASDEFRRVTLRVTFPTDAQAAWLFTGASALREDVKSAGYFVFVPARLADGRQIVVNRGFVPDKPAALPAGTFDITGYLRWPQAASWFVASHDSGGETWLIRDPAGMAQARGWGEVAPFYIDQEAPLPPGGLPKPGPLTVRLKNDHLNYALTWFSLAGVLTVIFLLWLWRQRRRSGPTAP